MDHQVHMSCEIQVKVTKYKCVNNINKGKQFTWWFSCKNCKCPLKNKQLSFYNRTYRKTWSSILDQVKPCYDKKEIKREEYTK